MDHQDEVELPPWEKWRRFGLYPFKLTLHCLLLVLITIQAFAINADFSAYSRATWTSTVNLFFPSNYQDFQTSTTTPYQYYIFTQDQAVSDSQLLVDTYNELPYTALNKVCIYGSVECNVAITKLIVVTEDDSSTYHITNSSSGWPLAADSPVVQDADELKHFFNKLVKMTFHFSVKSYGRSTVFSEQQRLCVHWDFDISYDHSASGQILVTGSSIVDDECEEASPGSVNYSLSVFIFIIAVWYELLLLKAAHRQFVIFALLRRGLGRQRTSSDSSTSRSYESPHHDAASPRSSRKSSDSSSSTSSSDDICYSDRNLSVFEQLDVSSLKPRRRGDRYQRQHSQTSQQSQQSFQSPRSPYTDRTSRTSSHSSSSSSSEWKQSRSSVGYILHSISQSLVVATRESQLAWERAEWEDIKHIVNFWTLISLVGNVFIFVYTIRLISLCQCFVKYHRIIFFLDNLSAHLYLKICLGFGAMSVWVSVAQYIEFFPSYYVIISTLKNATPRVGQFLIGVLPIFIGYALLGMVCFGDEVDRFGDITQTLKTLFSVVNGDVIYDTFNAVSFMGIGGQIYLYIYIMLFTYVVLMTIIAIVEEAFFEHTGGGRQRQHENRADSIETHIPFDDDPIVEEKEGGDAMRGTKRSLPPKLQMILKQLPSRSPPPTPTNLPQNRNATRARAITTIDTVATDDTPDYVTALLAALASSDTTDRESTTVHEADNWQLLRARLIATINSIDSTIESKQDPR